MIGFQKILEKMTLLIKFDWVPHGGLPTCLTVPRNLGKQEKTPRHSETSALQDSFYPCLTELVKSVASTTSQSLQSLTRRRSRVNVTCLYIIICLTLLSESVLARPMYQRGGGSRGRGRRSSRHTGPKPKWVNPCGIDPVMARNHKLHAYHSVQALTDQELMSTILLSAKNALVHADDFKEKFVQRTFTEGNWRKHHEAWKEQRYNWLPTWQDIPKHLHESMEGGHLQKLKLNRALSKMYNYLQRFAVGLEEVVYDQALFDGEFVQEFNEAEYKLKAVLCELQMAMLERNIDISEDVSRGIMSDSLRDLKDEGYRNLRDWWIYRDYMNGLEYVIHVMDHLKKQKHH